MDFQLGPYNPIGAVQKDTSKRVFLCDVTARDGEQTAGVSFSLDEKIELAKRLDAVGIGQIQLHAAGLSKEYFAEAKAICDLNLNANIEIMTFLNTAAWKDQVMAALDCGADIMHATVPVSQCTRDFFDKLSDSETIDRALEYIAFSKEKGAKVVNLNMLDCPRGEEPFLDALITACMKAGINRMRVNDTVGTAAPEAMAYLVGKAKKIANEHNPSACIGVHCHNDFGLATANTLAAVAAGADFADVSVNGLGERAGNAIMAEVAAALRTMYGVDCGIKDFSALTELSAFVARISGIPVPDGKPLVGTTAFSDQFDMHNAAIHKDLFSFQGLTPESVGNTRRILVGKGIGPYTLKMKLEEQKLLLPEDAVPSALQTIKKTSSAKKGSPLTDAEFCSLVMSFGAKTL